MALAAAARGYVLELGKVVISGTTKELLNDSRLEEAYLGG
jgi:branched-chain amino acid transport system ATP-binding protein